MTPHKVRVGAAQIDVALGDVDANIARHLSMIDEARRLGVELLVFPETSLCGYASDLAYHSAVSRDSPLLRPLVEASHGMTVVFGVVEEAPAAQFYNSCFVLRDAALVHIHRKLNLATYGRLEEGKYFAQGRYVESFRLPDAVWRITTLICADAWNPALVHLAALHGSTMLAVPTNSARDAVSGEFSNPAGWDLVVRFYALIYGMPIIMANRVGQPRLVELLGRLVHRRPLRQHAGRGRQRERAAASWPM